MNIPHSKDTAPVTVWMHKDLIARLDAIAKLRRLTRSEMIRRWIMDEPVPDTQFATDVGRIRQAAAYLGVIGRERGVKPLVEQGRQIARMVKEALDREERRRNGNIDSEKD